MVKKALLTIAVCCLCLRPALAADRPQAELPQAELPQAELPQAELPQAHEEAEVTVNEILVAGLRRTDEAIVRANITQRAGGALDPEKVSDDIKRIYEMGLFDDVRVDMEMLEGGLRLIYALREKPTITRVEFFGNDRLDDTKLQEQTSVSAGSVAENFLIKENADKLLSFYRAEGHTLSTVVPVLRRAEDRVYLTYLINEGPRVKIKKVKIEGNKAVSSDMIKRSIQTTKRRLFSLITGSGFYDRAKLEADLEIIKGLYRDKGYINASVGEPVLEFTEDKKGVAITLRVVEGERYGISSVGFSGHTVYTEEELRKKTKSAPGEVFSKRLAEADSYAMSEGYADKGYAMVGIYPDIVPDEAKKEVRLIFRIHEGDIYRIGRIDVSGNLKTRDGVIRRALRFNEGDIFSGTRLRRSYRNIINLNLFEDVNLKPEPNAEAKTIDMDIEVKEKPTGMLSVGGGYSSIDRWVGTVDVTEYNVGGRGQYVKLKGEFSGRSTLYELSFTEPWLFDRPVSFTASIYDTSRKYTTYSKKATGFSAGLGKSFSDYWRTNFLYRLEVASITDIANWASPSIQQQQGTRTTSSITPAIVRDSRDNFLDPRRGSRNHLSVTWAGLGGDNRFLKGVFDSNWFVPIGPTAISLRGRYGYAAGIDGRELPLYERFYVGGMYTVRGLGFGEAGPKEPSGELSGGNEELIFNAEYIFPLIPEVKLLGIFFYDAGSAFLDGVRLEDLRYTAGYGIRWISPIGPLRLEWGYNLKPKPGERPSRWDFTIGTFF